MRKCDYSQQNVSWSTSSPDLVLLRPCITAQLPVQSHSNRDLKIRLPRRQRERQKAIGLVTKTTILHTLFCTILCRRCTTTTWKCLNFGQVAAALERSHQWCLTLTPNNTKTIERMTCHCFLRPIRRDLTSSPTQLLTSLFTEEVHKRQRNFLLFLNFYMRRRKDGGFTYIWQS